MCVCVVRNPLVWSVRITLDQSYLSEKRFGGAASGLRLPLLRWGVPAGKVGIPLRPDSGESGRQELRMSPTLPFGVTPPFCGFGTQLVELPLLPRSKTVGSRREEKRNRPNDAGAPPEGLAKSYRYGSRATLFVSVPDAVSWRWFESVGNQVIR